MSPQPGAERDRRILSAQPEMGGRPDYVRERICGVLQLAGERNATAHSKVRCHKPARLRDDWVVQCGERGKPDTWYRRKDGVVLSFEFTFSGGRGNYALAAYVFLVVWPDETDAPLYLRFDYTRDPHADELMHPRSHLHPGIKDVRVPAPVLSPLELVEWFLGLPPNPTRGRP